MYTHMGKYSENEAYQRCPQTTFSAQLHTVFSLGYLRYVGPTSLQKRFCFDVERKEAKGFDVTTCHAQIMPSQQALNFSWGVH